MSDLATLGLAIDSSQMVKANADGDRFSASMDRAATSAGKLSSSASQSSAGMAQSTTATKAGSMAASQFTTEQDGVMSAADANLLATVPGVKRVQNLTQAEYDALTPDSATLYLIVG
jgi:hypothetical protein